MSVSGSGEIVARHVEKSMESGARFGAILGTGIVLALVGVIGFYYVEGKAKHARGANTPNPPESDATTSGESGNPRVVERTPSRYLFIPRG